MKHSLGNRSHRGALALLPLAFAGQIALSGVSEAATVDYNGKKLDIALPGETIPNQIVVVAKTADAKRQLGSFSAKFGASVARNIPQAGMQAWQMKDAAAVRSAIAEINGTAGFHAYENPKMSILPPPEVLPQLQEIISQRTGRAKVLNFDRARANREGRSAASGNGSDQPQWSTNDVSVTNQWALWRINDPLAPAPSAAVKGIAIIDTGIDYRHPDLSGKVVSVWDYVGNDADAMDVQGHGTHCAGIAAAKANNTLGVRGISPNSKIYAYRVLDENGSGPFTDIIAAIYAAANNSSVTVLSLSLGGYVTESSSAYSDMKAAVDYAVTTKGKVLVAAAGNEYNNELYYYARYGYNYRPIPAWVPNSFTVGAITPTDSRAYFSNYDISNRSSPDGQATYSWNFVDIVAPGSGILSTTMNDGYEMWNGTSMATPLVAGAVARVWDKNPTWTASQVRDRLVATGKSLCSANGFPVCEKRLDIHAALGGTVAGGFVGRVLDGESGQPLEGVKVDAVSGSTVAATATTSRAGYYLLPSVPSNTAGYGLRLSRSGYVTVFSPNLGNRPTGTLQSVVDLPIVPLRAATSTDENWRIVASWRHGEPGLDYYNVGYYNAGYSTYYPFTYYHAPGLEANAYLRTSDGYTKISWRNTGSLTTEPMARFMHDSYKSTPLEAHVIRDKQAGTYNYWISVDPSDYGWGAIKYGLGTTANPSIPTLPMVWVYKGNTLVKTISAASATRDGTGTKYWNVLNLTDSTTAPVVVINKVTDTLP